LQPRDLIPFIGSRNRVHEVLNRRRSLTLKMIWRLYQGLGIPAASLIKVEPARAA
jgi:HTH-type transcriptional regulator / antitoxin HigA